MQRLDLIAAFKQALKEARKESGLTITKIDDRHSELGYGNTTHVSDRWETDKCLVSIPTLFRAAHVYNVSVSSIIEKVERIIDSQLTSKNS